MRARSDFEIIREIRPKAGMGSRENLIGGSPHVKGTFELRWRVGVP